MSFGPVVVYNGAIASGASTLTSLDVKKAYSRVYAEIETMSTAVIIAVYGSSDGTTFKPVWERVPNTTSVQWQAVVIPTATTGVLLEMPPCGRYYQFRGTAVVSGGVNIKLICID